MLKVYVVFLVASVVGMGVSSPITNPLRPDGNIGEVIPDYFDFKRVKDYHSLTPNASILAKEVNQKIETNMITEFRLRWSTIVGSPVYSTPVIFPSGADGEKQIFINTYYQFAELLNHDGFKSWGWPLSFEDASFQTSPMIYDVDNDGNIDMGIVDKNGNLYWIRIGEFGEYLEDYHMKIPQLKVKRDWYSGLDPKFVDSYVMLSMFDRSQENGRKVENSKDENGNPTIPGKIASKARTDDLKSVKQKQQQQPKDSIPGRFNPTSVEMKRRNEATLQAKSQQQDSQLADSVPSNVGGSNHRRRLLTVSDENAVEKDSSNIITDLDNKDEKSGSSTDSKRGEEEESVPLQLSHQLDEEETSRHDYSAMVDDFIATEREREAAFLEEMQNHDKAEQLEAEDEKQQQQQHKVDDVLSEQEGNNRDATLREILDQPDESEDSPAVVAAAPDASMISNSITENEEELPADTTSSYGYGQGADFSYDRPRRSHIRSEDDGMSSSSSYYMSNAHRYGSNEMMGGGSYLNESEYIMVDAHVLASPTLIDINGDGHMEIVMAVSYYFDKDDYSSRPQQLDFDPDMYVAGGIACWDLQEQAWSWLVHLDLTTTKSKFQAMIYSSPTVADLDGDGRYEVIVGTALGLLYVMDGESGFVRRFFPMQFHSIQAQVVVGDLTGDRSLEMIVVDMGGTVAVVDLLGNIVWDAHLSGTLPFPVTLGDVDGDGQMDVIVVAATATLTESDDTNKQQQRGGSDGSNSGGSHIYVLRGDTGKLLPGYPISMPGNAAVSSPVLLVDLLGATAVLAQDSSSRPRTTRLVRPKSSVAYSHSNHSDSNTAAAASEVDSKLRNSARRHPRTPSSLMMMGGDETFPLDMVSSAAAAPGSQNDYDDDDMISNELHLIVTTFEGNIYIINGKEAASSSSNSGNSGFLAQRIDVGEHIYSMPLLDDITGDGYLDLLVGTLNGQLLLFESSVPFHPVNAWTSFPNHRTNGFTHGGDMGISIPLNEKEKFKQYDIKGSKNLSIVFDLWDSSYWKLLDEATSTSNSNSNKQDQQQQLHDAVRYTVSVTKGTNRLQPLWSQEYHKPGRYVAHVPVSPPEIALLVISMVSEHGRYFEDTVHVELSTRFYVWIKYMLISPVVILCFTLLIRFGKLLN